jgi:hypothetical protein
VKPSAFAYHDPRSSDDLMALLARLAGKHSGVAEHDKGISKAGRKR